MKQKMIITFLLSFIVLTASTENVYAMEKPAQEVLVQKTQLENGDSLVITMNIDTTKSGLLRTTYERTASKTVSYKNSSGATAWTFTVNGTFTYNGSTSNCTKATDSYNVSISGWSCSSASSNTGGNKAIGTVKMNYYSIGVLLQTITETVTISCDANGNIS